PLAARVGEQPIGTPGKMPEVKADRSRAAGTRPQLIVREAGHRSLAVLDRHDEGVRRGLQGSGNTRHRPAQPGFGASRRHPYTMTDRARRRGAARSRSPLTSTRVANASAESAL